MNTCLLKNVLVGSPMFGLLLVKADFQAKSHRDLISSSRCFYIPFTDFGLMNKFLLCSIIYARTFASCWREFTIRANHNSFESNEFDCNAI